MCERKAKKDAPAVVVSRVACVSRAPSADASRPVLSGWDRPAWSLRVNLLSTILAWVPLFFPFFHTAESTQLAAALVRSFSHFLFLRHQIICWPRPLRKG